jgi:AcrR family transcriptional regulator
VELFLAQGYEATTVNDIATAAGVSHMTFFRHFPTKESVVLDDPYDPVIATAVGAQPRDRSPLERVRLALLAAWSQLPPPADEQTRARVGIVAASPALRAAAWENNRRTEDAIVAALREDGVPLLDARVAAGACLGALMAALLDWGQDDGGETLGSRVVAALDQLGAGHGPGSERRPPRVQGS